MRVLYGFPCDVPVHMACYSHGLDYTDSSVLVRAKLCRLLLQSKDEAKWLPRPLSDEFLIRMWVHSMPFPVQVWKVQAVYTHTVNSILKNSIHDSLLVAILAKAKLCRLLLQLRNEAKQLPLPLLDEFLMKC